MAQCTLERRCSLARRILVTIEKRYLYLIIVYYTEIVCLLGTFYGVIVQSIQVDRRPAKRVVAGQVGAFQLTLVENPHCGVRETDTVLSFD